jgi:hypothetical protein
MENIGGTYMNKKFLGLLIPFVLLLIFTIPNNASAKVIWNGAELKKGQIGNLTILKQTELYKLSGANKTVIRKLNPGEVYRIYTFLPGKLGVGGGYYIDRDSKIKYQTPSKEKMQALGVKITNNTYQGLLDYPQVTNLISKTAQDKINEVLKKNIRASYNSYLSTEAAEADWRKEYLDDNGYIPEDEEYMFNFEYDVSYEVKYNENNQLSFLIYDYVYLGGAHGTEGVTSYNFNTLTGQQLRLSDVAKSSAGFSKIKRYAIADLTNRGNRGEPVFTEYLSDMKIDNNSTFYFTPTGIAIKFQEYEVGPYSAGMPEVKLAYKLFR